MLWTETSSIYSNWMWLFSWQALQKHMVALFLNYTVIHLFICRYRYIIYIRKCRHKLQTWAPDLNCKAFFLTSKTRIPYLCITSDQTLPVSQLNAWVVMFTLWITLDPHCMYHESDYELLSRLCPISCCYTLWASVDHTDLVDTSCSLYFKGLSTACLTMEASVMKHSACLMYIMSTH